MSESSNFLQSLPFIEKNELNITINSSYSEKRKLLEFLVNHFKLLHFDDEGSLVFNLKLALDEAITNAIMHGNKKIEQKKIYIKILLTRKRIRCSVKDEGEGFDYEQVLSRSFPDLMSESGRGILLINKLMDSLSFGGRGSEIIFEKLK